MQRNTKFSKKIQLMQHAFTGGGLIENIIRSVQKTVSRFRFIKKLNHKKFKWLKSKNISK